jgi:hypothetical protein
VVVVRILKKAREKELIIHSRFPNKINIYILITNNWTSKSSETTRWKGRMTRSDHQQSYPSKIKENLSNYQINKIKRIYCYQILPTKILEISAG